MKLGDVEGSQGRAETPKGYLPLIALTLHGTITGLLYQSRLTQVFRNPYDVRLEVTYIFPLPPRAALVSYRMEIGGRQIPGQLRSRAQARAGYEAALSQGQASTVEQERPDVLSVKVGGLDPGETLVLALEIEGPLALEGMVAVFRFPLVVGERLMPGLPVDGAAVGAGAALDTDVVPDASRLTPPVLLPGMPNPVALSLELDIDPAGLPITKVESSLHEVSVRTTQGGGYRVALTPCQRLDRDFVLRLSLEARDFLSSLIVFPEPSGGGTFLLTVVPPDDQGGGEGRDLALLVDPALSGWSLVAARTIAARLVESLRPTDRFTIAGLGTSWLVAEDGQKAMAAALLRKLESREAELLHLLASIPAMSSQRDATLVLLSNVETGDHDRLIAWAREHTDVRLHAVGIGATCNASLLDRLATQGGGCFLRLESGMPPQINEAYAGLSRAVLGPLLRDMRLEGVPIQQPSPERWDLFPGFPTLFHGRIKSIPTSMRLTAALPDGTDYEAVLSPLVVDSPVVRRAWARAHLLDLEDQWSGDPVSLVTTGAFGRVGDFWRSKSWALLRALPHVVAVAGSALFAVLPEAWRPERNQTGSLTSEEREELEWMAQESLDLEQRIAALSQSEGVLSRFTAFLAVDVRARQEKRKPLHRVVQPVESVSGDKKPESVVQLRQIDLLCVEVGRGLLHLLDPQAGAALLEMVGALRQLLAGELGVVMPGVRFRDNAEIGETEYLIKVKEIEVARGQVASVHGLAMGPEDSLARLKGRKATEPTYGMACVWLEPEQHDQAAELGCLVFGPAQVVATSLLESCRAHARELLGRQEVQSLVDGVKRSHPDLVKGLIPHLLSLGEVQRVLQNLVQERLSIGDLPLILQTLADNAHLSDDPEALTESVRAVLLVAR